MIICQKCKSQEPDGAIFCSECGTQLLIQSTAQTQKFAPTTEELKNAAQYNREIPKDSGIWVSLHLLDSGHIMAFSERSEYTLGRLSENQPIEPGVDLSPFKAFDNGVSRLHAVLKQVDD